ncbi:MAG: hypothetical protein LBR20_08410, partial [Propionibacteriaceae bacterium]|nr:hypothetical protein [Propionibacteriaceae bacterium]
MSHTRITSGHLGRIGIALLTSAALIAPAISTSLPAGAAPAVDPSVLNPVDPQNWVKFEDMTWADYKALPAKYDWANKSGGTLRAFKGAVVLVRFEDRGFLASTSSDDSSPLTNASSDLQSPIPEAQVPAYYADLLNDPSGNTIGGKLNKGHTINEYWMEQSAGRLSVDMDYFGPYTLPGDYVQYGLDTSMNGGPAASIPTDELDFDGDGDTTERAFLRSGVQAATSANAASCPAKYYEDPSYLLPRFVAGPTDDDDTVVYDVVGCAGNIRTDTLRIWAQDPKLRAMIAEKWPELPADARVNPLALFDEVFYVTAGHDESSTWEEFGQMRWTQTTVPDEYGPPVDPVYGKANGYSPLSTTQTTMNNWAKTRYIPWTSWKAAINHWPNANGQGTVNPSTIGNTEYPDTPATFVNAAGETVSTYTAGNSTQAESSGMGTFAHEFSHILGIGDNYGNPYGTEGEDGGPLRDTSGPWDILSRGSFNGPGGTHERYHVPSLTGGAQPAGVPLRDKIWLKIIKEENLLTIDEADLDYAGSITTTVTSRAVQRDGDTNGIYLVFDPVDGTEEYAAYADNSSGSCRRTVTSYGGATGGIPWRFDCDGGQFSGYTVEVIDRVGTDSFTPDSGVNISKAKLPNGSAPYIWTIDANPQDIGLTDYVMPDGTIVPVTRGDQRQLNDSLFHAGTNSGSAYEYVDPYNGLHFYITNMRRDAEDTLLYDVTIRSTVNPGPQLRGVKVSDPVITGTVADDIVAFTYTITNTGGAVTDPLANYDIYRLTPSTLDRGWELITPEAIQVLKPGESKSVTVYAKKLANASTDVEVTLTVNSENVDAANDEVIADSAKAKIPTSAASPSPTPVAPSAPVVAGSVSSKTASATDTVGQTVSVTV